MAWPATICHFVHNFAFPFFHPSSNAHRVLTFLLSMYHSCFKVQHLNLSCKNVIRRQVSEQPLTYLVMSSFGMVGRHFKKWLMTIFLDQHTEHGHVHFPKFSIVLLKFAYFAICAEHSKVITGCTDRYPHKLVKYQSQFDMYFCREI